MGLKKWKTVLNVVFCSCKTGQNNIKNSSMTKVLTKRIQTQLSGYFSAADFLTKPETRCLKDMAIGILKSKTVFINQIAASLREPLKLKDVAKRLASQYLKDDYADKVRENHLQSTCSGISKDCFILMDGTDISKKNAKYMEGLEFVRNGDTGEIGLGYNVLNINVINNLREITPLYSKAYSYEMGALSSNKEIKNAVSDVDSHLQGKGCWVFDREADSRILKDFFIEETQQCIIRLKQNTKLGYKNQELKVSQIAQRMEYAITQNVIKIKKNKPVVQSYELGAVRVSYDIKGKQHLLWLVVSRNTKHGGLCYLLVKPHLSTAIEVAKWAFKGYGLRWKIEEYHRHIKQEYKLEDIQIKTFTGLQSILAILTVSMYIIYNRIKAIHIDLLLDAGYNYLNEHSVRELTNFIYYKIGRLVSILLMPVRGRWNVAQTRVVDDTRQLNLAFD
jgi:hypothetical protein